MSVFKYRDPKTGEVKKVGTPSINAYSKEETDALIDGITAADVGAAPAGFGLGENAYVIEDWNTATKNGWYRCLAVGENTHQPDNEYQYFGRVDNWTTDILVQNAYRIHRQSMRFYHARRFYDSRTSFSEWEWVDPPMLEGTEYRTTERITGKAVYKRNNGGIIEYRLDGETEWKPYADAVGAERAGLVHKYFKFTPTSGSDEEIDNILKTEYNSMANGTSRFIVFENNNSGLTFPKSTFFIRVDRTDAIYGSLFVIGYDSGGVCNVMTRSVVSGVWSPWCWENPPLWGGQEYRTTARFGGKAIYLKHQGGVISYHLDGETTWREYASLFGGVKKSGDTMTGSLTLEGTSVNIKMPVTSGGWAQGVHLCNSDGTGDLATFGFFGSASKLSHAYIGFDGNYGPNETFSVSPNTVKFMGNEVLHTGNSNMTRLVSTDTTPTVNNEINWTYA